MKRDALESVLVVPPSSDITERLEAAPCHKAIHDGHAIWAKRKLLNDHSYGLMFIPVIDGEQPLGSTLRNC